MDDDEAYIDIDGHRVRASEADHFWNGDGTRVTDEQWDETKRRRAAIEAEEAAKGKA